MGNPLAIAAVTAVLRVRLRHALGGEWTPELPRTRVVTLPPDHVTVSDESGPVLNVCLWDVAVGVQGRPEPRGGPNADAGRGTLPITLSYLLSAHGVLPLDSDILLGQALTSVLEDPVITPDMIRTVLDPQIEDEFGLVPRMFRRDAVRIADSIDHLRLSVRPMSFDDWARVWEALRAPFRPSLLVEVGGLSW